MLVLQQPPDSLVNHFFCIKYPQGDSATAGTRKAAPKHLHHHHHVAQSTGISHCNVTPHNSTWEMVTTDP